MSLLPVSTALQRLLDKAAPTTTTETIALHDANGRVLATDLAAGLTQPPFDASAMDGYAVRGADIGTLPERLSVIGTAPAGHGFTGTPAPGETVRIYFGVGGPNYTSSFHVIGEIFDTVYTFGSITSPPLTNVQTVTVPPGGSAVVDFKLDRAGTFVLVDHALSRAERGLVGYLVVQGPEDDAIMHHGPADQMPAN